jgi:uncharacterized SAM-binding protein YcdF (DUF218 family)
MSSPARVVWDYLRMGHRIDTADLILVCGSNDLRCDTQTLHGQISQFSCRVADRAVELYCEGRAPRILFSGGRGNFTETWAEPEAVTFAERARRLGVPGEAVMLEADSSNTGENIRFSHRLLQEQNCLPQRIILVQKPFMERR